MKTRFQVFSGSPDSLFLFNREVNSFIEEQESKGFRVTEKSVSIGTSPSNDNKSPNSKIVVCLWLEADEMETGETENKDSK